MYLSSLDERSIYGDTLILEKAVNEQLLLKDQNGNSKWYTDLISAYGACNFGHCNPHIEPFKSYSADIAAGFYPKEAFEFSEWILHQLELKDYEILMQVGGSFAVSTSLAFAQHARKGKIAHLKGSFHGLGLDSLSITNAQREYAIQLTNLGAPLADEVLEIDPSINPDQVTVNWDEISCFIFEPVQGANGYVPIAPAWLKNVISQARKAGVIIIADEIQSGYYRHGFLSVSKSNDIQPDMYLFSKSLTNGLFPYSVVVYNDRFKKYLKGSFYLAHTFQTSALGCYAMMAVARYVESHPVKEYCEKVNKIFVELEANLKKYYPVVSHIHVTGPSISFQINNSKGFVGELLKRSVLVFRGGCNGERIRIAPPVTISIKRLQQAVNEIVDSVQLLSRSFVY